MSARDLMHVGADMLTGVAGLELETTSKSLVATLGGAPTIKIEPNAAGVVMFLQSWLGARPRASAKLSHLDVDGGGWEALYTESEWHVRGVLARAITRIESRTSLTGRLDAHLAGRGRSIPVGPDSPDYWKALAKWGKETEALSPADRRFAWMYAERLERKLQVSDKFAAWAQRKAKQVGALGFAAPLKDVSK